MLQENIYRDGSLQQDAKTVLVCSHGFFKCSDLIVGKRLCQKAMII